MHAIFRQKDILHRAVLWMLVLSVLTATRTAGADTVETRYPGLATGLLKSAVLAPLEKENLLAARYGIRSIPVQVFFDADGKEVFRHVGFFAQIEVDKQLAAMEVKQ